MRHKEKILRCTGYLSISYNQENYLNVFRRVYVDKYAENTPRLPTDK